MRDKGRLIRDLLKLGVCFRARLSENDLGVYAEMIEAKLDDREWAYAFAYFTGEWRDEAPRFMPTPQELIAAGRLCPKPPPALTEAEIDFRRRYVEALMPAPRLATKAKEYLPPDEGEWDARRHRLLVQADELLHAGEIPSAKK